MNNTKDKISRRTFVGSTSAIMAATSIIPKTSWAAKPNSNFNGVQVGVITYSYRSMSKKPEDVLQHIINSGISSIELMGNTPEEYVFGSSKVSDNSDNNKKKGKKGKKGKKKSNITSEMRLSATMDKFKEFRKMYNNAGVNIHIVKFSKIGKGDMSDKEIDYYFNVAKVLGAKGITCELNEDVAKKIGPFADKHKIWLAFHNHMQLKPDTYDGPILSYGKYLGINFDVGHYTAATNQNPVDLIKKYTDRIISLHMKDRQFDKGKNQPWGEGDTPIKEILQHLKKNKLDIYADIELEYKVPGDSDAVKEVKKCVEFSKNALK